MPGSQSVGPTTPPLFGQPEEPEGRLSPERFAPSVMTAGQGLGT